MKHVFSISATAVKKLVLTFGVFAFSVSSFATFSSGSVNREKEKPGKKLLANPSSVKPGAFSLRSGYKFRGNQVMATVSNDKFINLNTVVTFQQGRTTYVLPVKKKVSLNLSAQNQVRGATVNINF
ncbi:MAG: hypothetical protein ABWZ25_17390 [Chitinophagaceae bacterium]